jgi:hypothetical protein
MKETKYVPSGGLAFSEEKDMMKLQAYAKEGWLLYKFALLGYKLKKGEPQDIQYSLDYKRNADEDYYSYFEAAGWSNVCSIGNEIHIFSAPIGTKPIYSDKATAIEKYEREQKKMKKIALPSLIIFIALTAVSILGEYELLPLPVRIGSSILSIIPLVILVFSGMPYISYTFKLRRMRKG